MPDEVRLMRQNRAAGSDKHTSVYLELLTVQNRKPAVFQAETRPLDAEEGGMGENESGWTVRSGGKEEKWGQREGGGGRRGEPVQCWLVNWFNAELSRRR